MKAKLRLKYASRFRDKYNFEEKESIESKADNNECKSEENDDEIS